MEKIRLLIIDAEQAFAESVSRYLKAFADIEVLGIEQNGQDALRIIRHSHPDVILLDLILPGIDGLSLLREVKDMKSPPASICCTRFYSDVALEAARTYGVSYFLFKPIEMHSLHPSIISCHELFCCLKKNRRAAEIGMSDNELQNAEIRNYIVSIGVPSKLIWCAYLAEAIRLSQNDASLLRNLSKGLYLEISRSMNTTPTRIERCIRNAISAAFQNGGLDSKMVACPSNKEFINYVLRNIES